jgi:hypothetical protein
MGARAEDTAKNKKLLLKCLEKHLGLVTPSCADAQLSRVTYHEWYKTDPEFKKAVDDIKEVVLDFTEAALHKKIATGDTTAIMYHLKHQGKSRGYKTDPGDDSNAFTINVNIP